MIKSFRPVINKNTVQIIIGTMPGEASLSAGQYYAYRHNKFWQIVFDVFDAGRVASDYNARLDVLLRNSTGLWDALASCKRNGSLDKDILFEKPNDFPSLLKKYPGVKKLIFNGKQSHKYFLKYFGKIDKTEYAVLPSTSPANASKTYVQKLAEWRKALSGEF